MASARNPDLSIIILNFNVRDLLLNCLKSVFKSIQGTGYRVQVIVVDNASSDGSVEAVQEKYGNSSTEFIPSEVEGLRVDLIQNQSNLGFSAGNNVGVKYAKAPVILFLNPDTVVVGDAISKSLKYLLSNPDIGALTCRVELPDGRLDYSCHRGFPTPWNAFCYLSGLSKIFPRSSFFARYTATHLDIHTIHEIDCLTGAFLMVRKIAGEQIGWWDEDYFWNGEDIEFCYSLKKKGWKIYFYPEVKIIHYKGSSSGLWSSGLGNVDKEQRLRTAKHGISAMRIFYMKHYYKKYPPICRDFILTAIQGLEHYRKAKLWIYQ